MKMVLLYYKNGQEKYRCYYINDQFHNENGPAYNVGMRMAKKNIDIII